jgi:hypothetical protein
MLATEQSYEIDCRCGTTVRGRRLPQSQTVPCPTCGRPVFVFPTSPLPQEMLGSLAGGTAPDYPALGRIGPAKFWVGPAIAVAIAIGLVGIGITTIIYWHRAPAAGGVQLTAGTASQQWNAHLDAAKTAIADGAYRTAANELDSAATIHDRFPSVANDGDFRSFRRMRRQVALLADLCPESVEEIMRHAFGQSDKEWQGVFNERYAGKAIILDARFFVDASGRLVIDYQLEASGLRGEWDLQSLRLLTRLPLKTPQRLLIGFRLADISRTGRDTWAVRAQPESGVLLTDESLLGGLSISIDGEVREIIRRQATWEGDD